MMWSYLYSWRLVSFLILAVAQLLLILLLNNNEHSWVTVPKYWCHSWYNFKADLGYFDSSLLKPCSHIENQHFITALKSTNDIYKQQDHNKPKIIENSIAIGLAITTKGTLWYTKEQIVSTFPFFTTFLPSFCKTVSANFKYKFFLSYDLNDPFYTKGLCIKQFEDLFYNYTSRYCRQDSNYSIEFVLCRHNKQPARAQNDAMMQAYMANVEYYYRSNDDTIMNTPDWTIKFIDALKAFEPPNVGVVGPTHTGGNTVIMTYEFVHYTHFHIHGYYYPREFTDWFADDWMTKVYQPNNSKKLKSVLTQHTLEIGTRYTGHLSFRSVIGPLIAEGKRKITRYVKQTQENKNIAQNSEYVISMSLWDREPQHLQTIVRNAQLISHYFPKWTLRIYVAQQMERDQLFKFIIPKEILDKLVLLGAELVFLDPSISQSIIPDLWKYLVADDSNVKYFIVINTHSILSERDSQLTKDWLNVRVSSKQNSNWIRSKDKMRSYVIKGDTNSSIGCDLESPYFCIKELDYNYKQFIPHLFGAQTLLLKQKSKGMDIKYLVVDYTNKTEKLDLSEKGFFTNQLWPEINSSCSCYERFSNSFPKQRNVLNQSKNKFKLIFDEYERNLSVSTKCFDMKIQVYFLSFLYLVVLCLRT